MMSPASGRSVRAGDLVWIFGFPRSGTTWLAAMMGSLPGCQVWNEPYVGALFGEFYTTYNGNRQAPTFIMAPAFRLLWLRSIRSMILQGAAARFPQLSVGGYVVIKEPHGCLGARLLSEALPESRMILLIRDPRDVIASNLDSQRKGSWTARNPQFRERDRPATKADTEPDRWVRNASTRYMRHMNAARDAYEGHGGLKTLVKYEDLLSDTAAVLGSTCSRLLLAAEKQLIMQAIEQHAWKNIPADEKGPGHFYRKGETGGWEEDLTADQIQIVSETAAPILDEFYAP